MSLSARSDLISDADLISLCWAMFQILNTGLEETYMSTFLVIRKLLYYIFAKWKKPNPPRSASYVDFSDPFKYPREDVFNNKNHYQAHSFQLENDSTTDLVMSLEFIINIGKVCLGLAQNSTPVVCQTDHQANTKYLIYFTSVTICHLPTDNME